MGLFSRAMVEELQRLPGASHSFLKQVCSPEAAEVRESLIGGVNSMPPEVADRLAQLLSSLDNRRFFQGYAELAFAWILRSAGWEILGLGSTSRLLRALRPSGGPAVNLLACAFVHSGRLDLDEHTVSRLHNALGRVRSNLRFSVFVRKWLPASFDPEPVRRAVELWLRDVEAERWDSRFAAYEDESVALEFGLVGDLRTPQTVRDEQGPVLMTVGPFISGRTMGVVEHRLVMELDRYRLGPGGREPVLVAAVADRPWRLSRGYLREFLYGKPAWVITRAKGDGPSWEAGLSNEVEPCLFKDGLYGNVAGVAMVERDPLDALTVLGTGMSNALSEVGLESSEFPFRTLARSRTEDGQAVIRYFEGDVERIRIGS